MPAPSKPLNILQTDRVASKFAKHLVALMPGERQDFATHEAWRALCYRYGRDLYPRIEEDRKRRAFLSACNLLPDPILTLRKGKVK